MRVVVGVLAVVLLLGVGAMPVGAQQGDDISIDVPTGATASEPTTIAGEISLRDRPGTWETEVTVTLQVDGETVTTRTVQVADGDTTSVSFSYTFDAEGTYTVTVIGEASYGAYTYEQSAHRTVRVDAAATARETVTVSTPAVETPTIATPSIETPSGPTTTLDGALFPVPAGLQDDVDDYRATAGDLGPRAFVVATDSEAYIVFTDEQVRKGAGSVTGRVLAEDAVSVNGITFGVLAATSVDRQANPRGVGVQPLASSPADYSLDLVRVDATHSVAAVRYQPESGGGIDSPHALGMLSTRDPGVRNLSAGASTAVFDPSMAPLAGAEPRVFTTSTRRAFWADGRMAVTGVVLPPETTARRVASAFDAGGMLTRADGEVVVSVTESTPAATDVTSVADAATGGYEGEVVRMEAAVVQTRLSTQELLTRTSPCGETKVPVKEVCVPVPNDVVVHSGVAWEPGTTTTDDALVLVGASARAQEEIVTAAEGRYRVTGRVVSLQRVDGRLPDRRALVVTRLERVGELDRGVPKAVASLNDRLNASIATNVSLEASASAEAAATEQRSTDEAGREAGPESTDGGDGRSPTGQSGPGFGLVGSLLAGAVLFAHRLR